MSPFAMLIPSCTSLNRTLLSTLSVPLLLVALLLATFITSVEARYVSQVQIGSGVVDHDRFAGPRWQRVNFKPLVSGTHAIDVSWDGDAEVQFSLFKTHNAPPPNDRLRIATSSGNAKGQRWTGILNQSEQYYLGVWAASGSANFTATLKADTIVDDPIEVLRQPSELSVTEGEDATFSVTTTGSGKLNYQWFADDTAINGATSDTLVISAPPLSVSGTAYSVVISDDRGSVRSEPATLTINEIRLRVGVTEQPADLSVTEGQDAIFKVTATGTGKLSYQWFVRTTAMLADNTFVINPTTQIPDANGATLIISSVTVADSLSGYSVVITDDNGSVTSDVAILSVDEALATGSVSSQPVDPIAIVTEDEIALVKSGSKPPESQ